MSDTEFFFYLIVVAIVVASLVHSLYVLIQMDDEERDE